MIQKTMAGVNKLTPIYVLVLDKLIHESIVCVSIAKQA